MHTSTFCHSNLIYRRVWKMDVGDAAVATRFVRCMLSMKCDLDRALPV